MTQVSLVPILLWVAALAAACIAVWRGPRPVARTFVIDRLLRYVLVFPLGLLGLWGFVGHVFFPAQSAASIGWADSPFQFEVGVANLGLGLASLYAVYEKADKGFAERYLAMLAAGGTKHHKELLAPFGLDASDPNFWSMGLKVIENLIDELEALDAVPATA